MDTVTRRAFVTAVGAAALVPTSRVLARPAANRRTAEPAAGYVFFDAAEVRFVEAACARLIPADGAGTFDAGVCTSLDAHLASSWGRGESLYRSGPWQPGTPTPRQRGALTPAEVFRAALGIVNRELARREIDFAQLPAQAQDALLAALQAGDPRLGGRTAAALFDMLLSMTVESFFGNVQGARRSRIAWRMTGYPGAHAASRLRPGQLSISVDSADSINQQSVRTS
jgi:gluconate 2-dehydrogenase gamma chain